LLGDLIECGLDSERSLLLVFDGGKAFRRVLRELWGSARWSSSVA
jgi:hypothetical protein